MPTQLLGTIREEVKNLNDIQRMDGQIAIYYISSEMNKLYSQRIT